VRLFEGEAAAGEVQELETEVLGEDDQRRSAREQPENQQRAGPELGDRQQPLHHVVAGQDHFVDDARHQRQVVAGGLALEDPARLRAIDQLHGVRPDVDHAEGDQLRQAVAERDHADEDPQRGEPARE